MLKKLFKSSLAILTSAATLCLGLPTTASAIPFNSIGNMYFFGDSLTDSGFNDIWTVPVPRPVGKAPTFTTFGGYTWAQYISHDIKGTVLPIYPGPVPADTITNNAFYAGNPVPGFVTGTLGGFNYAAGGSTTNSIGVIETWAPSLNQQVNFYLANAESRLDPNAVYFIWSGANDFLALVLNAPPLPTQVQLLATANTAAINIANAVSALAARGAKRFVVLSLPNLGMTPLANDLAQQSGMATLPANLKTITFTFNSMLNQQLGKVISKYKVNVLYEDVYTLINNVILATQQGLPYVVGGQVFKFVNYTTPACAGVPTAIYCPSTAPTNYIYADSLHPTDMAHRLLSVQVEQDILAWK